MEKERAEEEAFIRYLTKRSHSTEGERERLLEAAKINLVIENYSDIFSDFDPRPFSQRSLSEDFLAEAKRATKSNKAGQIEFGLLIAEHKRNLREEYEIKKRLHDHFRKHFEMLNREMKKVVKRGILMILFGVVMMIAATSVLYLNIPSLAANQFLSHLLVVVLEPAGWFTFWTGLDEFYKLKKDKLPDYDFYEKMSKVDIKFWSY